MNCGKYDGWYPDYRSIVVVKPIKGADYWTEEDKQEVIAETAIVAGEMIREEVTGYARDAEESAMRAAESAADARESEQVSVRAETNALDAAERAEESETNAGNSAEQAGKSEKSADASAKAAEESAMRAAQSVANGAYMAVYIGEDGWLYVAKTENLTDLDLNIDEDGYLVLEVTG